MHKDPKLKEAKNKTEALYYKALKEVRKENGKSRLYKNYRFPITKPEDAGIPYYEDNIYPWINRLGEETSKKVIKLLILYTRNDLITSLYQFTRLDGSKLNSHVIEMTNRFENYSLEKDGKSKIEKLYERYYDPNLDRKHLAERAKEMLSESLLRK